MATDDFMARKGRVLCPVCGDILRPDVVLYGEALHEEVFLAAIEAIRRADTLIVGGTSLVVYPAAGLLNYYRGNQFILLNRDPTPADSRADIAIHGDIAEILPALVEDGEEGE